MATLQHSFEVALVQVLQAFQHNWPYLAISIVTAAALRVFLNPARMAALLQRHQRAGVVGATTVAVATPLCSCGTTVMALGMIANLLPWAPVAAFLASSPLTSPEELIYSAGLFGWSFAWMFLGASVFVGLAAGGAAWFMDRRGWLANQVRLLPAANGECATGDVCGDCACGNVVAAPEPSKPDQFVRELTSTGWRLGVMFFSFAFLGYFLNTLVPTSWMASLFGRGSALGVPLAATLGFPVYLNSEASLPLVRTMIDAGMSEGAALAFLVTGAGTSLGAIAGLLTIARWRVVALVVGTLWLTAVLWGGAYNMIG